jgi:amphi-Trp domain-containing protein
MSNDGSFRYESLQDTESIIEYLDVLRQGFASGKLRVAVRDKEMVLEPKGLIEFHLEVKRKDERQRLSMKFTWKDEGFATPEDEPLILESE